MTESRDAAHFERIYQSNADPWGFQTSAYEQAKFQRTLAVLDGRRFANGLEVGCSIGYLSRLLAEQCEALLGLDIVETPLAAARARCADQPWVRFEQMQVPGQWPAGQFDLMVFSEVLYFLTAADIARCVEHVRASLQPGGIVVLVNWLGQSDDPHTGDQAAERFIASSAGTLQVRHQERHDGYRLDVLS